MGARQIGLTRRYPGPRPKLVGGAPTQDGFSQMLGALMPDDAIISNESVSFGRDFYKQTHAAAPHDWLNLAGGAIGDGLPVATGAAIASGAKRRVISLQADGFAMYSLQALWTQAREKLPCTTILLNNRKYNILIGEYRNVGARPGTTAMSMLDLSNPLRAVRAIPDRLDLVRLPPVYVCSGTERGIEASGRLCTHSLIHNPVANKVS